jgi:predicted DNA-binding transcriptional regulator YafY
MCEDGGRWYLEAYCLLRIEERTFRLDRMDDVSPMAADAVKEYGEEVLM